VTAKRRNKSKAAALPPLPALPPRPVDASAQPAPPPQEIIALGEPPIDAMDAQSYAHRALVLSMYDAARDERLSPRERRKELRSLAYAVARLMPQARLREAERLVLDDQRELEVRRASKRVGAKLEAIPPDARRAWHAQQAARMSDDGLAAAEAELARRRAGAKLEHRPGPFRSNGKPNGVL